MSRMGGKINFIDAMPSLLRRLGDAQKIPKGILKMYKWTQMTNCVACHAVTVYQNEEGSDSTMLKRNSVECRPSLPCFKLGKTFFQREIL
jgi:hypothetical protein